MSEYKVYEVSSAEYLRNYGGKDYEDYQDYQDGLVLRVEGGDYPEIFIPDYALLEIADYLDSLRKKGG